tara:strand:- start:401 stop:1636 length:1236 start_codon:yes stop_codon:yes gene_type:complete
MENFLKNQKYLAITIFSALLIISSSWYLLIQKNLKKEHKKSKQIKNSLTSQVSKYKNMQTQIRDMQYDWETLNNEFKTVIERIPDKRLYESVTDYLYSLIINHGLKIQNYSPSDAAIDKKNIFIAETGEELLIEKIPIDITVKGSFISFGQLLESMLTSQYRLTASNIEVAQKDLAASQTIKFISYTYFQTVKNESKLIKRKSFTKNNLTTKKMAAPIKNVEAVKSVDKTVKVNSDSLEGVPEMWLEPATEPIDDSVPIEESITLKVPVAEKVEPAKKTKPIKEKKTTKEVAPIQRNKYEDFHSIVVLESKMCQKVKNNQPINPGRQFPIDIGKVFCHSLLNNNSGKHNDIYHIWYLNGDLKAKVRIRVRSGKEIPAISHREFGNSDKGRWRIEITDGDKKILDTIIFELV